MDRKDIIALIEQKSDEDELDLSFTDLSNAHLGSSAEQMPSLDGTIFGKYGDVRSGTYAENTLFQRTSLRKAKFTYAVLKGARFYKSDLTEADLRFADLTGAVLVEAVLVRANLFRAKFADTNLRGADLRGSDLYLASFSGQTELSKENIGEYLIQENEQEYKHFLEKAVLPTSLNSIENHLRDRFLKAVHIYQGLRTHFESNGKYNDAVWAFRKERRMRKKWNGQQSINLWKSEHRRASVQEFFNWLSDWIVELLCDYGESAWRVVGWILALILIIGPIIVSIFGGLDWTKTNQARYLSLDSTWRKAIYVYSQYLLHMLDTITTASFSELKPANDLVRLASGIMASAGILLVGLLGFVAGNRIRHS